MVAETYGRAVIITFASFSLKRSMNDCDKDYLRIGDQKLAHPHITVIRQHGPRSRWRLASWVNILTLFRLCCANDAKYMQVARLKVKCKVTNSLGRCPKTIAILKKNYQSEQQEQCSPLSKSISRKTRELCSIDVFRMQTRLHSEHS